ncbi:iron complex outermembrane recepter protein [Bosea sp. TND4EK4]|nr:iron complex outermembrane recepter protein [Bosea sp. TND4EK4]
MTSNSPLVASVPHDRVRRPEATACAAAAILAGFSLACGPAAAQQATSQVQLDEIVVEGAGGKGVAPAYAGGQVATGARLGVLGDTDTGKAPFSVTSYTEQFVRDRQARTASEALALDPSVRATQGTNAPFDSLYIRGFPFNEGTSGEFAFDGVYGVAPSFRVFSDYAERIEVLKGPSAAMTGVAPNGGIGGVVNVVPKRAGGDLTRYTVNYGSNARFGGQLDLARRFGANREWGVRFVTSLNDGRTAVDHQKEQAGVGALALDYQGERFRAWAYGVVQTDRFNAPSRPFFMAAGVPVPKAPDGRRNVTQPWEYSDVDDRGGLLRMEYDLTDRVTVFGSAGGSHTGVERYFASAPTVTSAFGTTSTAPQFYGLGVDRQTYEGGIRAKFETGFIRHAVTLQLSRYVEETSREFAAARGSYVSNLYNPVGVPAIAPLRIGSRPRLSDSTLTGLSAADVLSALDDRILLTVGLRRQTIKAHNYLSNVGTFASAYDKSATTPFAGLVVKPWEHVSFYGNYVEGLSRGDIAPATATNAGEILAPYVAKQIEAGVKLDVNGFGGSLAAFQITRPVGELSPARRFSESGEQRVRGLEFTTFGQVTPQLRLLGGATLLDGELTRAAAAANIGHTPIGVPRVQLNLGAEWDLPWIKGLTLNAAVIHTGKQFVDAANTQSLPDWTRLDLGLRYATDIAGRKTTFRANVVNATDAKYWAGAASFGTFTLGAPRTYLVSMSMDL